MKYRNLLDTVIGGTFATIVTLWAWGTQMVFEVKGRYIDTSGTIITTREPLWDNMTIHSVGELVTPQGETCSTPQLFFPYEKTTSNTVSFKVNQALLPCLKAGSIYRVTYKYGWLRGYVTEHTVVPAK